MHHQEHIATARFWSPPERERVSLCMLASVGNTWLPVERTAAVCDISKICPSSEDPGHLEQGSTTNHSLREQRQQYDEKEVKTCENFMGFRIWRFPTQVSSSTTQESSKDNVASLKSSHLSSQISLSKGWEEMKMASAVHPGSIQQDDTHRKSSSEPAMSCTVLQTVNLPQSIRISPVPLDLPLVDTKSSPKVGFSSITFSARMVPQASDTSPLECRTADPRFLTLTHGGQLAPDKDSAITVLGYLMVDCDGKLFLCKRRPASIKTTDRSQSVSDTRAPEFRCSVTEGQNEENAISGCWQQDSCDFLESSAQCSHWSCSHLEVSVSAMNSFLYLNRELSVSLGKSTMEPSRADVYRSSLSLRLQNTTIHRQALDTPGSGNELERPWRPSGSPGVLGSLEFNLRCAAPASTQPSSRLKDSANNVTSDLNMCCLTSKVLLPESRHLSPEALSQVGAENKKSCQCQNYEKSTQGASDVAKDVNAGNFGTTPQGQEEVVKGPYTAWSVHHVSEEAWMPPVSLSVKSSWKLVLQKTALDGLTLREALELFRPDFISRSQDRLRALEQRALKRRPTVSPGQGMGVTQVHRRRKYTKPLPLSDNLFKPKERVISGKEMQSRSKRIYNKLPEVMKKKEEEKKKIISQTNRLRVEVFKKKLLEQVLQRTHD